MSRLRGPPNEHARARYSARTPRGHTGLRVPATRAAAASAVQGALQTSQPAFYLSRHWLASGRLRIPIRRNYRRPSEAPLAYASMRVAALRRGRSCRPSSSHVVSRNGSWQIRIAALLGPTATGERQQRAFWSLGCRAGRATTGGLCHKRWSANHRVTTFARREGAAGQAHWIQVLNADVPRSNDWAAGRRWISHPPRI